MKTQFWIVTGLLIFASVPAKAGFEWVPSQATSTQPAPMQTAPRAVPTTTMPQPTMPAVAPAPVSAAPIMAPNTIPAPAQPVSTSRSGLYINPYPLQDTYMPAQEMNVAAKMAENGGRLTPVQLGAGMTSGVRAPAPIMTETRMGNNAPTTAPTNISPLTPMIGGEPAPLPMVNAPTRIDPQPMQQYAQAVGFGKNLPLALALSQVIPSEYSYQFNGDVNTDMMVSWDGGKPWNVVLNDMLRSQNMTASIQGSQVIISPLSTI